MDRAGPTICNSRSTITRPQESLAMTDVRNSFGGTYLLARQRPEGGEAARQKEYRQGGEAARPKEYHRGGEAARPKEYRRGGEAARPKEYCRGGEAARPKEYRRGGEAARPNKYCRGGEAARPNKYCHARPNKYCHEGARPQGRINIAMRGRGHKAEQISWQSYKQTCQKILSHQATINKAAKRKSRR